jgi:hypothetical protein
MAALMTATIAGQTSAQTTPISTYPWNIDYHQTLTMKLDLLHCSADIGSTTASVDAALTEIKNRDFLTRGIPKIIYFVGWQEYGHDATYPELSRPNPYLKRSQDSSAAAALDWLMIQAKKYNTTASFHINMRDAYNMTPLFTVYQDSGCILGMGNVWCNHQSYLIDNVCEFNKGLAQKRIDACVNLFPTLSTVSKTIHADAFDLGIWAGIKNITIYWRQKWGMDLTAEGITLPGFIGFAWHFSVVNGPSFGDQFNVPAYIDCGGDQGAAEFGQSLTGEYWGADAGTFLNQFALNTLPWYYLNRLIRISKNGTTITYSNNVVSTPTTITRNGESIRNGNDVFVPALWRTNREIISYSASGFSNRSWALPPEWSDVSACDIYNITVSGLVSASKNVPVASGHLTLSVAAGKGVSIVPAGTDPESHPVIPPSGTAAFTGIDSTTHGTWTAVYGSTGYSLASGAESLPSGVTLSYVGGANQTWAATTTDNRALQTPGSPSTRFAARRETINHFVVDVDCGAAMREVDLYLLDWASEGRNTIIDVMDINNYKRLDSKIISGYSQGKYVRYSISGRVQFRITRLPGATGWTSPNAGISGVFFGGATQVVSPRKSVPQTHGLSSRGAPYRIELYDMCGVLIHTVSVSDATTHDLAAIISRSAGPLTCGVYFMRICYSGSHSVERMVKFK